MLGLLIIAVLFAALVYSGKVSQPAYAGKSGVSFMSKAKKQKLWHWYRTSGMRCVHREEAAWNDPNAPYWGGFQMGMSFMKAYGRHYGKGISYLKRYGTADKWPVIVQISGARHGYNRQGLYTAWPNTSRECGL